MANPRNIRRVLRITKPYASGQDVKALQAAANDRLRARGQHAYILHVDGVFGPATSRACARACFLLGASMRNVRLAEKGTLIKGLQRLVRHPNLRTPAQLARAISRRHASKGPSVMFDSVTLSNIPGDAPAVAGYTAGNFPTFSKLAAAFPKARHLSIAIASRFDAECLDIENGDATPQVAPGWVQRQRQRGVHFPKVYASQSEMPLVLSALGAAGIDRDEVRVWSAHFTGVPHICSPAACGARFTADATQWTDKALGRSLDESKVTPAFWD